MITPREIEDRFEAITVLEFDAFGNGGGSFDPGSFPGSTPFVTNLEGPVVVLCSHGSFVSHRFGHYSTSFSGGAPPGEFQGRYGGELGGDDAFAQGALEPVDEYGAVFVHLWSSSGISAFALRLFRAAGAPLAAYSHCRASAMRLASL